MNDLTRLLRKRMGLSEIKVVWFGVFGTSLDDDFPGRDLGESVIELCQRAERRKRIEKLHEEIVKERADLAADMAALGRHERPSSQFRVKGGASPPVGSSGTQNVAVNAPSQQVVIIQNMHGNIGGGSQSPGLGSSGGNSPGANAAPLRASAADAEVLKTLNAIADNENFIRQLGEKVKNGAIIPFVGAGLSMPFGMPLWADFLLESGKKYDCENEIAAFLKESQYEEAAEFLLKELGEGNFHNRLDAEFGSHKLKDVDFSAEAAGVLPRLATGPVITTNFDQVLEKTFEAAERRFERVVIGGDKTDWVAKAVQNHAAFLLKIHGDVEDRTERILTVADYRRRYGADADGGRVDFTKPLPRHLKLMMGAKSLLFLGCSLKTDRLTAVLSQIATETPGVQHYAIVAKPDDREKFRERSRELDKFGISPIWHPDGRYDLIKPLLEYLAAGRADVRPS